MSNENTEIIHETQPEALPALTRQSEHMVQVETAKRWPRNIANSRAGALALATIDEETAESCFYALKRGSKVITGPSARLAEICAYSWQNLMVSGTICDQTDKFIMGRGVAWDMEKNVKIGIDVPRRITDRQGRIYNDDMIVMTGNAAISIAIRNAIFKVIPRAFVSQIENEARKVAVGDIKTLSSRLDRTFKWFGNFGIEEKQIFEKCDVQCREDMTLATLEFLTGLKTAIRSGDTDVDQSFPKSKAGKGFELKSEPSKKKEKNEPPKNEDTEAKG